jgi:hypothetical protein
MATDNDATLDMNDDAQAFYPAVPRLRQGQIKQR